MADGARPRMETNSQIAGCCQCYSLLLKHDCTEEGSILKDSFLNRSTELSLLLKYVTSTVLIDLLYLVFICVDKC